MNAAPAAQGGGVRTSPEFEKTLRLTPPSAAAIGSLLLQQTETSPKETTSEAVHGRMQFGGVASSGVWTRQSTTRCHKTPSPRDTKSCSRHRLCITRIR